jgi:alpha-tubulin suppressor-like RCC1 family protein
VCPQFGQLGIGSNMDSNTPVEVAGFGDSPVSLLSCGWRHTFAVTEAGQVYSWGRGVNGQLGHNELKDTCATAFPLPRPSDALRQFAQQNVAVLGAAGCMDTCLCTWQLGCCAEVLNVDLAVALWSQDTATILCPFSPPSARGWTQ